MRHLSERRTRLKRSSAQWFKASPCRAALKGLPSSPEQHHLRNLPPLHGNLIRCSWCTVVGVPTDPPDPKPLPSAPFTLIGCGHLRLVLPGEMLVEGRQGDISQKR